MNRVRFQWFLVQERLVGGVWPSDTERAAVP